MISFLKFISENRERTGFVACHKGYNLSTEKLFMKLGGCQVISVILPTPHRLCLSWPGLQTSPSVKYRTKGCTYFKTTTKKIRMILLLLLLIVVEFVPNPRTSSYKKDPLPFLNPHGWEATFFHHFSLPTLLFLWFGQTSSCLLDSRPKIQWKKAW